MAQEEPYDNILEYDDDNEPIIPDHFDEWERSDWAEGGYDRVGLRWERDVDLENILAAGFQASVDPETLNRVFRIKAEIFADNLKWVENRSKKDSHWSSEHNYCSRKVHYRFLATPKTEPMDISSQLNFAMGDAIEGVAIEAAIRAGIFADHQRYFRHNHPALKLPRSGKADLVILDPFADGDEKPVEVKSSANRSYETWSRDDGTTYYKKDTTPRKDHVLQLYDYVVDNAGGPGEATEDDYGYVIYVNKDTNDFVVHRVFFNQQLYDEGVYYDAIVEWYDDNDRLAPRHPNAGIEFYINGSKDGKYGPGDPNPKRSNFPCMWEGGCCDHLTVCWKDELLENGNEAWKDKARSLDNDDDNTVC